jgi:uncharacterized protein
MAGKLRGWDGKLKRTVTSVLPVSPDREGFCSNCGACCRLPNECLFLRYRPNGESYCSVHALRPLNCRKYPRVESEFITEKTCSFSFKENI